MITLVFPYFNNGKMLLRHIQEWSTYQNLNQWNLVITDDCSQHDPITNYISKIKGVPFHSIQIFRIKTDISWNQDGARNLCFSHIKDSWCVSTDADHLLDAKSSSLILEFIQNPSLDQNQYFMFHRSNASFPDQIIDKPHPNSYLIHSHLYWLSGGYEEKLAGYYGKDANFKRRLQIYGKDSGFLPKPIHLTRFFLSDIEDSNTVIYGRKDSIFHVRAYEHTREISASTQKPEFWLKFAWEKLC
jgi:hypothetical protein